MTDLLASHSPADIEAEIDRLRRKHSIGIAKKLEQMKELRTALLRAEVNKGKVHRKGCLAKKPQKQQALELVAA